MSGIERGRGESSEEAKGSVLGMEVAGGCNSEPLASTERTGRGINK